MNKYKKILLIAGFIIIILILGYLLYSFFFKTPPEQQPEEKSEATTTTSGFPEAKTGQGQIVDYQNQESLPVEGKISDKAQGGLTQTFEINKTPALGATLGVNGSDLQYYDQYSGKFYKVDKNGNISSLSDKIFYDVENIKWSPTKNKAILEYPDGSNIIYDFTNNKQITLPKHWKDFDFSTDGNQIVMKSIGLDPDNRWLAVANEDGSKAIPIESIGEKDATVYPSWSPNNQTIAMYTEGIDFNRQEVFFVGLNNENFKSTVIEGRGFQPKWSPEGDQLIYSVYSSDNNLKPNLWIVNAQGENIGSGRKNLNVETWADKCVFAGTKDVYCAVPENLEEGAGLFPELAKNTHDYLYKIDSVTGLKKLIAIPDNTYNMSNLIISDNGYYLYFTDETTQKIYKIKLK